MPRPGGLYVIEDVRRATTEDGGALIRWMQAMQATLLSGAGHPGKQYRQLARRARELHARLAQPAGAVGLLGGGDAARARRRQGGAAALQRDRVLPRTQPALVSEMGMCTCSSIMTHRRQR